MDSIDLLRIANVQCHALVLPLLRDLTTAPLVQVTPGGNHAHWILGHLIVSEGGFREIMDGTPSPFARWKDLFGAGSRPSVDGTCYPPYEDLLNGLEDAHAATLAWIGTLDETDLDRTSVGAPPGFESLFGTWRRVLTMRPLHWMNHRGQLADCRRAAGRDPLLA